MANVSYLNSEVRVTVNSQEAVNAIQNIYKSCESLRAKLKELETAGLNETNIKDYNSLVKELNKLEGLANKAARQSIDLNNVIADLSGQKLKDLRSALRKVKSEMDSVDPKKFTDTKAYEDRMKQLQSWQKAIEDQIDKVTGKFKEQKSELVDVQEVINNIQNSSIADMKQALKQLDDAIKTADPKNYASQGAYLTDVNNLRNQTEYIQKYLDSIEEATATSTKPIYDVQYMLDNINIQKVADLQAALKQVREEMENLDPTTIGTEQYTQRMATLREQYKKLSVEIAIATGKLDENAKKTVDVEQVMNNLAGTSLRDLRKALQQVKDEMENASANGGVAQYQARMRQLLVQSRALDEQIQRMTGTFREQDGTIMSVVKRLSSYVLVYAGFNTIKDRLADVFRMNLEFSDSLADIRKTTGLSAESVKQLSDDINKIDTRTSVEQLHNLAYEAGRLGIGGGGADAVLQFVRAANQINVALGEDLGEDAVVTLSKMNDVMGLTAKMGVEKSLLATGSAINELAQNSTASGAFMTDYASRLSGIAAQAHLTTAELLALAAASDATGQEVEVSATAMNKFVVQLQTHYRTVANTVGLNADNLKTMMEQGRTIEAVVAVLEALNKKGGLSMIAPMMGDLGSDGSRLIASMATLAQNIDLVKTQLEISNKAFKEATSVTQEYNIKNDNAAAIMERMRNAWEKMFVNSSNTGLVKELAQDLYDMTIAFSENKAGAESLRLALVGLVEIIKLLLASLPVLVGLLTARGLTVFADTIKRQVIPALATLRASFLATTAAANGTMTAWKAFTTLMKSNAFLLAASLLAALIAKMVTIRNELSLFDKGMRRLNEGFDEFQTSSGQAAVQADELFNRLRRAEQGSQQRADLIKQINEQYKSYIPALLTEASSLSDIETAQKAVNEQLRASLALKAKNNALDELGMDYNTRMAESLQNLQAVFDKRGLGALGKSMVAQLQRDVQGGYDRGVSNQDMYLSQLDYFGYGNADSPTYKALNKAGATSKEMSKLQQNLQAYIKTYYDYQRSIEAIVAKYDPLIGNYQPKAEPQQTYQIVEGAKEADQKKEARAQLEWAREMYRSVMASIEVYYQQQEQAVNDAYEKQVITITEREMQLRELEKINIESRVKARSALHNDPGAQEDWQKELDRMKNETLSFTEETDRALINIRSKDLQRIGDLIRQWRETLDDEIWKNLETDKSRLQELRIEIQQEIEQIIMENDFTVQVTRQYAEALQKLKLFFPAAQGQIEAGMKDLANIAPKLLDLNIDTKAGRDKFREFMSEATGLSQKMVDLNGEQIKALYYKTLEYADAMTEAAKKARERTLKIANERWRQTGRPYQNEIADKNAEKYVTFQQTMTGLNLGTDNLENDAEIALYQARLEAAMEYYEYLQQQGADTTEAQLAIEERIADLSEALVEKVRDQLDILVEYGDDLASFGTDFGEAIFGGIEDRKNALESFVKSFGNTTKQLILNWTKEKIQHALIRKAMVAAEKNSQKEMLGTAKETSIAEQAITIGGKEVVVKGVQQLGQMAVTQAKAQAVENVATTASETQAGVSMGIAAGAAKTIARLGWWGIPLVAVITALLNGLLSAAMSKVGGLFGGGKSEVASAETPTKLNLVQGMLTYDRGNVQTIAVTDGKTPVLADNGQIYEARVLPRLQSGLVTEPTLTTVGGAPALVGEEGPELVVGRETTRMIQLYRPDILQQLAQFDSAFSGRGVRAYANGNISDMITTDGDSYIEQAVQRQVVEQMTPMLNNLNKVIQQNNEINKRLTQQLSTPIRATIQRDGKGGLTQELIDGLTQERNKRNTTKLNKLFGK